MIVPNSVLLLKAQIEPDVDKYTNLITSKGYAVRQVKTLDFVFKNLEVLKEKLQKSDNYSGIILSSPRCVQAVAQALNNSSIYKDWQSKKNFVVGEATYRAALDELQLECEGKETGNAVNLAKVLIQSKESCAKPFLFPHGNLKTGTLSLELGKEGLSMDEVLVYDSIANPNMESELAAATKNFTSLSEYVVFFSPSGVRSSISFLRNIPVQLDAVKFIAIGPVTELAMREHQINVHSVAKYPTAEDVLASIIIKGVEK